MATQDVDFEIGIGDGSNDSGNPTDTNAIKPLIAGERVRAAVLNRPHENLRKRTETLRTEVSNLKYLMDSDVSWIITGGDSVGAVVGDTPPTVTWNPTTGKFVTSADIVVQPIAGPITDKDDSVTYTNVAPWSITLGMSAKRFAGGHLKSISWTEVAPAVLAPARAAATITYTPYATLNIQICNDGTTLVSDIHTALNPIGEGFSHVITGSGVVSLSDISPLTYVFDGVFERELHYITPAVFSTFFAIPNSIVSGDTLCIYYEWLVDPTISTFGGRRQATPTANGGAINTVVSAGQLFLANSYPERLPLAIPICRRIGDALIFVDGTVCMGTPPSEFPSTAVSFGVNQRSLAGVAELFSASTGSAIVGVAAHTAHTGASVDRFTISASTLQAVLEAFQLFANDKASLDQNETLTGDWLQSASSAWYIGEASGPNVCRLLWRTGVGRPDDGSVGWTTISKYQLNNHGVSSYESMLVTLTGGYLTYDTSWKINTPATGAGNVTVEIEICASGLTTEQNRRGSYRIYAPAAASTFELLPADVLSSDYTSGFSTLRDDSYLFGGTFYGSFGIINLNATIELSINTPSLSIEPISETATTAIHPHPKYYGDLFGVVEYGHVNKVLDGLTVVPASGGVFGADTITLTPGRAFVGGKLITVGAATTLNNVSTAYKTAATFAPPLGTGSSRWYGVWLRSDGAFRVGSLPDMGLHTGLPGVTSYTIPYADVETSSGYYRHSYTLVDIVWCYDYDSTAAHQIRYAGMTHLGGGLHVYHQAKTRDWSVGTALSFVAHNCVDLPTEGANLDVVERFPTNAINTYVGFLPGIPTSISGAALLGVYFNQYRATDSTLNVALLHSNATLVNNAIVSTSNFAPPIVADLVTMPRTSLYTVTKGTDTFYTHPVWAFSKDTLEAPGGTTQIAQTVVYPLQRTLVDGCGDITVQFQTTGFGAGPTNTARLVVTNLGFFWDRYNPGGIY